VKGAGTLTVSGTGSLLVGGTFPAFSGINTFSAGSTVTFNGSGSQTIPANNYFNLISSGTGARILASSGIVGVSGTFTPGTNTYTNTGSTVSFNGAGQTVPALNYNNLNLASATTGITLAGSGIIGISGTFTLPVVPATITGSTIQFNGSGQTVPAYNYNNLDLSAATTAITLAGSGTVGVAGAFTAPGAITQTVTGSTVSFNGSNQTVPAFNFYNLNLASATAGITLVNGGTIGIAGSFTAPLVPVINTGNTINFNGTVSQTIPAINYTNLTSSNTGPRVLPSSGIIGISGSFIPGTNSYTITGSTIQFNGDSQSVPAFNYNNLNLASATTGIAFAGTGTTGIAGAFTVPAVPVTIGTSTISFNGASQTVPVFNYYNLKLGSATTAITLASGTIGIGGTFTVPGAITQTTAGNTIQFTGASQIVPAFNYGNLDLSLAQTAITLSATGTIGIGGTITLPGFTPIITGGTINFNGPLAQTIPVLPYNNLFLSNAGTKTFSGAFSITGALNISGSAVADLGSYSSTANSCCTNVGLIPS